MTIRSLIIFPLILLCLTACSSTRFAYRHADWFINWAVDDYISFDSEQQTQFDTALEDWLGWHCSKELPRYGDYLRDLSAVLSRDTTRLSDASLLDLSERATEAWTVSLSRGLSQASRIFAGLSHEQVAQLLKELDNKNQDFKQDYVSISAKKLKKLRVGRVRDAMTRWAGSMSDVQLKLTLDWAHSADNTYGLIFARRLHWRDRFQYILSKRPYDDFEHDFTSLLLHPELLLADDERDRLAASQQSARQLLLFLERSLSEHQREHFLAELAKTTDDLKHLSTHDCLERNKTLETPKNPQLNSPMALLLSTPHLIIHLPLSGRTALS
jgi:hypothetical protein